MRRNAVRAGVGAAIAAVLVALTGPGASAAVDTARQPQIVVGVGSDTTYELMNDLDQLYNQSPGCAVIPSSGSFTNVGQTCLDPGLLAYSADYGDLIQTENLYHDMIVEAEPVGSGNGTTVLTQALFQDPNANGARNPAATLQAEFNRRSSSTATTTIGTSPYNYNLYESAYARDGLAVWIGRNNVLVNPGTAPANPTVLNGDLLNTWEPDGSSKCFTKWQKTANDAISSTKVATTAFTDTNTDGVKDNNTGNIQVFATQSGSGTGNAFDGFISGQAHAVAANLQGCIPPQFKNGVLTDGEHVIFENIANPICKATSATGGSVNLSSKAIFPYSFGRFVQNAGGAATSPCRGVVSSLDPDAAGAGAAPVKPSATTIGNQTYIYNRLVYNYFAVPVCEVVNTGANPDTCTTTYVADGFDLNDPTTWNVLPDKWEAVLDYLHPTKGWLCKTSAHAADPALATNIRTQIDTTITGDGFGLLGSAAVGGTTFSGNSYCRSNS